MLKELDKCEKLENGLQVMFGGYFKRDLNLKDKFEKIVKENDKVKTEKEVFGVLES